MKIQFGVNHHIPQNSNNTIRQSGHVTSTGPSFGSVLTISSEAFAMEQSGRSGTTGIAEDYDHHNGIRIINFQGKLDQNMRLIASKIAEELGDEDIGHFHLNLEKGMVKVVGNTAAAARLEHFLNGNEEVYQGQTVRDLVGESAQYANALLSLEKDSRQRGELVDASAILDFLITRGYRNAEEGHPGITEFALWYSDGRLAMDY